METAVEIGGSSLDGRSFCKLWGDRKPEAFKKIFFEEHGPYKDGVFPLNPAGSHQRLHLQQGLFLAPVSIDKRFAENLKAYEGYGNKVLKVLVRSECRDEILLKLHRAGTNREFALSWPGRLRARSPIAHTNTLFQPRKAGR